MSNEQILEGTQANVEIQNETQTEQIVTEELAEKLGVSKTLVGKPIDELGKSLRALQTDYAKTKTKLKEVEKEKQKEAVKPNLQAPVWTDFDNDEEYKRAAENYSKNVARQEVETLVNPYIRTMQKQQEQLVMDAIQKELPEGMDVNEVANEWMEAVGFQAGDEKIFAGNVNMLRTSIVNYAKSKKLKEVETALEKDTNDLAMQKIRNALKKQSKDYELNSVDRTKTSQNTVVQRLLKRYQTE